MEFSLALILLFTIATAVAVLARWLKLPYTVALVVTGLALGSAQLFEPPHLTQELLYALFLPGLLFEAAFHLELRRFLRNKIAIQSMAIPGLIVAILLTAVFLTSEANALEFVDDFPFSLGLVFAALIAATDPIAVVGLFKSLGAPKRLAVLVEGESLFNDGTAVVVFTIIVSTVIGGETSLVGAIVDFVKVVGLGVAVGGVVGYAVSLVIHRVDDPMLEITLTMIAAYGSFIGAEHFHFSGVIATVTAGMMCGNYAARTGMQPTTRVSVETFWEYWAFALNSLIFLLIGLEIRVEMLLSSWKPIVAAYLAVVLARAIVVFSVSALLRRSRERIPWRWSGVVWWAGLRGALSMVLVLGLPKNFPYRDLLVSMTFGVVVLSILIQGLSMSPLLRWLGLTGGQPTRSEYEQQRGRIIAARAAQAEIERLGQHHSTHPDILRNLGRGYRERLDQAHQAVQRLHEKHEELHQEEESFARRTLLVVEKDATVRAYRQGLLSEEACTRLLQEIDQALVEMGDTPE